MKSKFIFEKDDGVKAITYYVTNNIVITRVEIQTMNQNYESVFDVKKYVSDHEALEAFCALSAALIKQGAKIEYSNKRSEF